ncbi:sugar phosphate isomerase/epimerase [Agromyces sp. SYSU K20354]|uniref:sugar phosphate isomerase/epimerase family protein n=1 Tax=Agromyces cavernae TaxID=2898659 RepID=UPI001E3ECD46|nr:sugar phosphate isomerase/epimerase family protein [Agromyces cavernae]MCD2441339.1 sugar phosphate isomerase/epimerase [Agromyces cavernae]
MWKLSGIADEISDDLVEQFRVSRSLGLSYVELRSAWNTNVLDLSHDQLAVVRSQLKRHGLRVSSVASPVGKISITDEMAPELDRLRRAIHVAEYLDAPYIRIFSFSLPDGCDPATHRDEVITRMKAFAEVGEQSGVVLLHENDKGLYGATPERCLDIIESVRSAFLALAWDSANFVRVGLRPFDDGYVMLRPYLAYVQIKDAIFESGTAVPAGRGDGQLPETVRALSDDGYDGFLSLEPHLGTAYQLGGLSDPELFAVAHGALRSLLESEGISYR